MITVFILLGIFLLHLAATITYCYYTKRDSCFPLIYLGIAIFFWCATREIYPDLILSFIILPPVLALMISSVLRAAGGK